MATKPNVKSVQDLPPPGGYPPINVRKGIRPRGPSGATIWAMVFGATIFGLYFGQAKSAEKNRLSHQQKREARMAITPFLMAEQDRRLLNQLDRHAQYEAEVMKGVDDWVVGESRYSKRWSAPKFSQSS